MCLIPNCYLPTIDKIQGFCVSECDNLESVSGILNPCVVYRVTYFVDESFFGCPLFGHMVGGSQPCVDLLENY